MNTPEEENQFLTEILEELVDDDPCWYDHHGYCQAHWLHEAPCPVERAKEFLANKSEKPGYFEFNFSIIQYGDTEADAMKSALELVNENPISVFKSAKRIAD